MWVVHLRGERNVGGPQYKRGWLLPPPLLVADGPIYFFLVAFFGEAFFAFFIG
jgi:hypothetical protein